MHFLKTVILATNLLPTCLLSADEVSTSSGANSPTARDDIPWATREVIRRIRKGQSEDEVRELMKPVALDHGRITWGGTGSGRLYFKLSSTRQIWVEIDGRNGPVWSIGEPEPYGVWKRDHLGNFSVSPREQKATR